MPLQLEDGIQQQQLADRLGVSRESIRNNVKLGREHFAKWSQQGDDRPRYQRSPDPDGLAWEQRANGLFYPIAPSTE